MEISEEFEIATTEDDFDDVDQVDALDIGNVECEEDNGAAPNVKKAPSQWESQETEKVEDDLRRRAAHSG